MNTILFIILLLFTLYGVLLLFYWKSWNSIPVFSTTGKGLIKISVIIPARNEEENIGQLLTALQAQTYPSSHIEIVVIDDHSTDRTAEIAKKFSGVNVISLREDGINSYKKKAIETGISLSSGELIVTTDADCIPRTEWLSTIVAFKQQTGAIFIAAPVSFTCNGSLLQIFQLMDFMVLQGITGAAVFKKHLSMSNGANLAYERRAFIEVDGFNKIDHIASGDDMLLMHKIAQRYPDGIHYLKSKEAIVSTLPMTTWRKFINQRIRWASKATQYNDPRILPVLLLVYLFNLSLPFLLIAGIWNTTFFLYAMLLWLLKTIVELPLYASLAGFFEKRWSVKLFPFFQPLHIAYTLVSGFLGQFGKYEWKGRKIK
ncbi:glycosyltransferase [Terrimonas sp. NA20]|uniref:Glycosyltransferase n=1 Tax=Terrimonas ginsenosidimutans TaxID=2908004 RepID=A0ABS9KLF5_9BACT|nr:glycosyltransferase [Terrimonas ginsenosidimutans]MCG2613144.1 glycosyltransferase [Terrimonas ginsenosidimutans]